MNRIMVVDDEAIQRRVLGKMIREYLPGCEVVEAGNGRTALDMAQTASFDVVITDIKMPIMDGFDFIEHMNKLSSATRIIILSSYRYFEYAQRALRLGAFDYVLKPVKEESIGVLLDKVRESIEKEKRISPEEIGREHFHISMNAYYTHLLGEWVQNGVSEAKFRELRQQYSLEPCGAVIITRVEDNAPGDLYPEGLDDIRGAMPGMLASLLSSANRVVSFFASNPKLTMISVLTAKRPEEVITDAVLTALEEYGQRLSCNYQLSFAVGVGNVRADLCREALDSYKEAEDAADFRYFLGGDRVVQYAAVSGRIAPIRYNFHKDEELFKEYIRTDKADLLLKHTEDLFRQLLENGLPYREQWLEAVVQLVLRIAPAVKGFFSEEAYQLALQKTESSLTACISYEDCRERFLEILRGFMMTMHTGRGKKHAEVIDKCVNYIEEHYTMDISLEQAASLLYFSPNYLSVIFKSYLGVSFTKYLSDIRLDKAAELLRAGDMKVYEIAGKVGFKDEKYFYRVFKAKYGLTPDEYRKKSALPSSPS
ncbi:two-component system response regulator YesN [Paenibacillus forsythiae]|uniref:Two-component system response regulator YesN n=1 Tax=Paenibacillus forsythiae TaxID=365616 RepID=A0ABU3H258_9BACL|nr:response regulator [Paenibacillus forsythiae]MDT3424561.1 two-component system response regulator YesN [Paenibacillus forsythiae]